MITSSEICLLKLVIKIIEIGRDENQIELTSIEIPLILMNVISDLYCNCNLNNFSNLNSFKEFLRSYLMEDEFIDSIISLSDFSTIDDLIDLFDSIPNYLICPDNLSPNKVLSPYCVTSESVIGLTLRSLFVKWESSIFEDVCLIYDDLIIFLHSSTLSSDEDDDNDSGNTKHSNINHLHSADKLSKNMDAVSAIDHLHMYYDLSHRDSIQSSYMTPPTLTLTLPNPAKKHQQAMLSMATIFMRSGNVAQAINSVEEALKTSHQRNDKQSVSQALLLLQYITFVSNESSLNHVKKIKMESTLHHLIGRFNELNLKSFAASARLLLTRVKLKSQISLKEFDLQSKLHKEDNELLSNANSGDNSIHIQEIWMNLLLVQLGEFLLHDSISNSNPVKPPNSQPESSDKGPLTLEELGSLPLQVSLVYTKTLIKLGLFDLAILECKKTLHSCLINPSIVDKEDLISICCIWAKLHASRSFDYSIVILFHDSSRHSDHSKWYQESVALIEYVIKEFNIDEKDVSFNLLNSSLVTIRLWESVQFKHFSEALSSVKILIEILEPDSPKTKPKSEYIEALLIYSSLIFGINVDKANLELINVIELTSKFGLLYFSAIATILKTLQDLKQKPEDEKAAVIVYKNIRDLAYLQVIPELVRISIICEEMINCKDKKLMTF